MSKGFILLGINTDEDRIRYASLCAASIKTCDINAETCLVVDKGMSNWVENVKPEYLDPFDYIVELPYGNSAWRDGFHGMNIWQMPHCTPFEETIYVDYDTIFHNIDIDTLWQRFSGYEIAFTDFACNYRNRNFVRHRLMDMEFHYNLPKLFSNLIYFKKDSANSVQWFKMADPIMQNWRDVYKELLKEKRPDAFNKTLLCNLVTNLLAIESDVSITIPEMYDLHLYGQGLWHWEIPTNWTDMLNYWYTDDGKILIENHTLNNGIIHYRDENFITDEIYDGIINNFRDKKERTSAT